MGATGLMAALGLPLFVQTPSSGPPDTLFLMLLALVVFGPRRLPEIGRQIGKLMYEFRKVSNDFKFQMEEELRASEEAGRQRELQASPPPSAGRPPPPPPRRSISRRIRFRLPSRWRRRMGRLLQQPPMRMRQRRCL